jgi:hypothetical protein
MHDGGVAMRLGVGLLLVAGAVWPAGAAAGVKISEGRIAPSGLALVSGKMPKAHRVAAKAYVLSADKHYSASDVLLGAGPVHAKKGLFKAWISPPGDMATGKRYLLACAKAKPSKSTCWSVGAVAVHGAPAAVTATATLDSGRARDAVIDTQGGSVSATAADGTKFTVTVPSETTYGIDLKLTPVTTLTPASAAGTLIDGVMIEPVGGAPPGSTLEIDTHGTPPSNASVVGWGGLDPAVAAFPLPVPASRHIKIALVELGGYAVTRPASAGSPRAPLACAPVRGLQAAGSRPVVQCSEIAQRIEQQAQSLSKELAAARQDELSGKRASPALESAFKAAAEANAGAVEGEMNRILDAPPTDEGAAEVEVLIPYELGIQRQVQLSGLGSDDLAGSAVLAKALQYFLNLARSHCSQANADSNDVAGWGWDVFALARQFGLVGKSGLANQSVEAWKQCLLRARFEVDSTDDTTDDNGLLTVHVTVSADHALIHAQTSNSFAGFEFVSDPVTLTYASADATPDPSGLLESAAIASSGGDLHLSPSGPTAQRRVRCDKTGHFHIEHDVKLWLNLPDIWQDTQTVNWTFVGGTPGSENGGAAGSAWGAFFVHGSKQLGLPVDDSTKVPVVRTSPPPCPTSSLGVPCYGVNATFLARSMPAGG